MPDPFPPPPEPTPAEAIAAIDEELKFFDDDLDRFQVIIDWGRALPPFPPEWQQDEKLVQGCQARVWLQPHWQNGRLWLAADSDAPIVKGLAAILLRVYGGRSAAEIAATDPGFLKDFGLLGSLSMNRGNGVAAMARRIQALARASAPAA
ncbi:MAG: SufE family protein [Acetobacteraceae bacterium]|nr:SufE family protein [Acetobacteraceae bacterium]